MTHYGRGRRDAVLGPSGISGEVDGSLVALCWPTELRLVALEELAQRLHPDAGTHLTTEPPPDLAVPDARGVQAVPVSQPAEALPHYSNRPSHGEESSLARCHLAGEACSRSSWI